MAELTAKQQKAALLLAQGEKVTAVATTLKVRRETVSHWRNNVPEFREMAAQLRRELWEGAIARAVGMVDDALDAAHTIVKGSNGAKPAEQLAAARLIIESAARVDAAELADRVAALEAQQGTEGN